MQELLSNLQKLPMLECLALEYCVGECPHYTPDQEASVENRCFTHPLFLTPCQQRSQVALITSLRRIPASASLALTCEVEIDDQEALSVLFNV